MSNAEFYKCDGTQCTTFGHKPLVMDTFDWSNLLDGHNQPATLDQLADIVVLFISKGWCKYCCAISPNLYKIQQLCPEKFSLVILNQSFIEKPYQEEGFNLFKQSKEFYDLNYYPEDEQELKDFRLFLRDHCIEFPAFFVFDKKTGKIITNDGYNAIKSIFDLKTAPLEFHISESCRDAFHSNLINQWSTAQ